MIISFCFLSDMTQHAEGLVTSMRVLNEKRKQLSPQLDKIDALLAKLEYLDRVVNSLDEYTLKLLTQFQALKR